MDHRSVITVRTVVSLDIFTDMSEMIGEKNAIHNCNCIYFVHRNEYGDHSMYSFYFTEKGKRMLHAVSTSTIRFHLYKTLTTCVLLSVIYSTSNIRMKKG